jgi:sugar lactone lactonase YvrE
MNYGLNDVGSVEQIVSMMKKIEGKKPMFPDDLDVAKDGTIYWSDASTSSNPRNLVEEALAGPTGRLVKFDPLEKKNSVLISDLHFTNGVQLSKNEDFVLVAETFRARVWR